VNTVLNPRVYKCGELRNQRTIYFSRMAPHYVLNNSQTCAMAQAVSRRPLTAAARFHARVNPVGFVMDKVTLGQVFFRVLRFSPVSIIPPWAPNFRKFQKIVLSLIHLIHFTHSLIHSHPGTNNRPVKAAAVQ
jgi:hypothetical protein